MRYTKHIVYLLVVSFALARSFTLPREVSNLQPNGYHLRTLEPLRIAPKQSARKFCSAKCRGLQSSSAGNDAGSEGSDKEQGQRQRWNHRLVKFANRVSSRVLAPYNNFMTRFRRLSKRGKRLVAIQLFLISLLFGSMSRGLYTRFFGLESRSAIAAGRSPIEISYSSFMDLVEHQKTGKGVQNVGDAEGEQLPSIDNIRIGTDRIAFRLYREETTGEQDSTSGSSKTTKFMNAYTKKVSASPELIQWMRKNELPFRAMSQKRANAVTYTVRTTIVTFYALFLWRMYRTMNGAAGNNAKDTPGKLMRGDLPSASFEDIQGIDSAKMEVMELVDTLRNPDKYSILGARAPTGLLLEGPPGTGKTMLARATAASAGVPLLYCSGSDFVEMFVGRGAARVRKMFERATRLAPCIIFIDELDTLGKARDSGANMMMPGSRGNDEAEQTLNQLLACMDGLDSSRRICVLAATNRKDVLDPALIRPGRFDRIVKLTLPNAKGRENILRVHAQKLPGFKEGSGLDDGRLNALGKGKRVDLSAVAAVTDGLSGADLEFVVNEAAIRAVRRVSAAIRSGASPGTLTPSVTPADFEASIANFIETRRSSSNNMWKNVWGT